MLSSLTKKIVVENLIKLVVFLILFYIFSFASVYGVIFPFAISLLWTLAWCKQNLFLICGVFVLSQLLCGVSAVSFVVAVFSVLVLLLVVGIHIKLKKSISFSLFLTYFFLAQLSGNLFSAIYFDGNIIYSLISVFVSTIFIYLVKNFIELVLCQKVAYAFSKSQIVGAMFFLLVLSSGLVEMEFFNIPIIKFFACLVILISSKIFSLPTTILIACVLGLGGVVSGYGVVYLAPFVLWAIASSVFQQKNKIFSCLALIGTEFCIGYFVNLYYSFSLFHIIPVVLACFVFLLIPAKFIENLKLVYFAKNNTIAEKNIINRGRQNLCKKLYNLSDVFADMDYVFRSMVKRGMDKDDAKKMLATELKNNVCGDCPDREFCHRKNCDETENIFEKLIFGAMEKGKTTLLDLPAFLTTRCQRVGSVVNTVNKLCLEYKNNVQKIKNLDTSKILIADQLFGVSKIMKELAVEVNKNISFDAIREEKIIKQLAYYNIVCGDVAVYEQNQNVISATLVVSKKDSNKTVIPKIVSKICASNMVVSEINSSAKAGFDIVVLKTAPRFDIAFGTASCVKNGEKISGDCYSITKIANDKYLLALCDGMGSGNQAEKTSSLAIGLIENFYKAGFENDIILSSVNKLLNLNKDEIFSALDVCVVDTKLGEVDFIKMGAPASYVKHDGTISKINAGALPLGIIQKVEPLVIKKMLAGGDYVFMFTDGVCDSFESEEDLQDYVNNLNFLNPQSLAEKIIKKAISNVGYAKDDMTIIVAKIFQI